MEFGMLNNSKLDKIIIFHFMKLKNYFLYIFETYYFTFSTHQFLILQCYKSQGKEK